MRWLDRESPCYALLENFSAKGRQGATHEERTCRALCLACFLWPVRVYHGVHAPRTLLSMFCQKTKGGLF